MSPLAESRNDFRLDDRLNNGRCSQRNSAHSDQHDDNRKPAASDAARRQITIANGCQSLNGDIETVDNGPALDQSKSQSSQNDRDSEGDDRITNAKQCAEAMANGERHSKFRVSSFEFQVSS